MLHVMRWRRPGSVPRFRLIALLGWYAGCALAAGPSVPYVPTPQPVVERMLEIAQVTSRDYVIDLGSGDGRIVITAAKKFGARGFGVDLNPERIREASENARSAGVADKVAFYRRDLFDTDLGDATVITMYLLPRVNMELRPRLLRLKPGTRIVSHDFSMEDWKPDVHVEMETDEKFGGAGGKSDIYFWVVPAPAEGAWQWEVPVFGKSRAYAVSLAQKFQTLSGSARVEGRSVGLRDARLHGAAIRLRFVAPVDGVAVTHEFEGEVDGDTINGTVRLSGSRIEAKLAWTAHRVAKTAAITASSGVNRILATSH